MQERGREGKETKKEHAKEPNKQCSKGETVEKERERKDWQGREKERGTERGKGKGKKKKER